MVVIGAGDRGTGYARWARRHPDRALVVGVAEPREARRATRLFGTRAELADDGQAIRVYDFLTRAERLITPTPAGAMNAAEGHGGGDAGLMDAFTGAVATGNRALIMSGPRESLASHLAVFAAERARLNGTVETIPPYAGQTDALSRTEGGNSPDTR